MYSQTDMGDAKSSLAQCLHQTFSDVFMMYFMAHSYHWNVKGPEFTQFHDFFSDIYEDVFESIDPLAENIRKLGFNAPMHLLEVCNSTTVAHSTPPCDPISTSSELYAANSRVIEDLYKTFDCASSCNQQGVADFIAGRIDAHEKWHWQLGTTIGVDSDMIAKMPGKIVDGYLVEATPVVDDRSNPMFAAASKPAPKKDRIYGSKKNKPGSAKAKNAKSIKFSDKTETALRNKMKEHNEKAPAGRKTTMAQLKAVYRRGAGAYSSSHRPGKTRDQWAMARVNAYLKLLKSGRPDNSNYNQDNDLLPAGHPKSSKKSASAISASGLESDVDLLAAELTVTLEPFEVYESTEHAIIALAEFSDLGYEVMPSLRAAWKRAVAAQEDPFERAYELATLHHDSRDADLLPRVD